MSLPLTASAAKSGKSTARPPASKKDKAAVCVKKLNVIEGCEVCGAMMEWLKKGGIKLDMSHVDHGAYPLYPTVEYSDGTQDHGEKMYAQEVQIPARICVISCSSGTN
jgi:hypothetical protein